MKYVRCLLLGILAGIAISLGSVGYVGCVANNSKVLGAFLFALGLLLVCAFKFNLFTGKIGYLFDNKKNYLLDLLVMYIGNIIGACGSGFLFSATSVFKEGSAFLTVVQNISTSRAVSSGEPWQSALILGIFCGMLVFFGVHIFKNADSPAVKVTGLVFAVAAFIIAGTEHCIANMFYFSAANMWNGGTILNIVVVTIGNSIGALLLWTLFHFSAERNKPQ